MKFPDISAAHESVRNAAKQTEENVYRWAVEFLTDPENFQAVTTEGGADIERATGNFFALLESLPLATSEKMDHIRWVFLGEVPEYQVLAVEPFTLLRPESKLALLHAVSVVEILFELVGKFQEVQDSMSVPIQNALKQAA